MATMGMTMTAMTTRPMAGVRWDFSGLESLQRKAVTCGRHRRCTALCPAMELVALPATDITEASLHALAEEGQHLMEKSYTEVGAGETIVGRRHLLPPALSSCMAKLVQLGC